MSKLKFWKLYKAFGDGRFASFCREQLRITRWRVNEAIKASKVSLDLMYAGFDILPYNIAQAMVLSPLSTSERVHAWRSVLENIEPDRITAKSIRKLLFPPTEEDIPRAILEVTPTLHESIHREASERGVSIVALIQEMFDFYTSGGNSHLFPEDENQPSDAEREAIWLEDLEKLKKERRKE